MGLLSYLFGGDSGERGIAGTGSSGSYTASPEHEGKSGFNHIDLHHHDASGRHDHDKCEMHVPVHNCESNAGEGKACSH